MSNELDVKEKRSIMNMLGLCSGAQTPDPVAASGGPSDAASMELVEEYRSKIEASWFKSTIGIIETCRHCAEAEAKLTSEQRKCLYDRLPFDRSWFQKLVKIGRDVRLQSSDIVRLLPASATTIYALAKLQDDDLSAALKSGIVRPGMTRCDLTKWLNTRPDSGIGRKQAEWVRYAVVSLRMDMPEEDRTIANELLEGLQSLGADVRYHEDPRNERNHKR